MTITHQCFAFSYRQNYHKL